MGKKELLIVFFICSFFLALSLISNIRQYVNKPTGTVYTFLHNSVSDYPYYISFIRQGKDGNLTTIDQFTTEPQTPGLVHIFYLLLGLAGKIINLTPVQMYFISRIVLGLGFLLISYKFISLFFHQYWERIITLCIFLTGASFPKEIHFEGGFSAWSYLYWWTEMDPLNRITFIPHFLFGHISLILMIYLLIKNKNIFTIAFWGLITGFVHPPSLGMTYYILASLLIIKGIKNLIKKYMRWRKYFEEVFKFITYFAISVPSLVYIFYTTTRIFPWTLMGLQESLFYAIQLKEYLLAIGPIFPLALIGGTIYLFIHKNEDSGKYPILFLWIIIDIVMIPLSELVHYSTLKDYFPTFANIRYLSMAIHLPLSILTGLLLIKLYRKNTVFFIITFFIYLVMTTPMLYTSIKGQMVDNPSISRYVYVDNNAVGAITYLNNRLKNEEAVLANEYISQMTPLYSNNKVYFGQAIYTKDNLQKKTQIEKLFNDSADECDVYSIIDKGNIKYLLAVNQKERDVFNKMKYSGLKTEYPLTDNTFPAVLRVELNSEYRDFCRDSANKSV